MKKNLVNLLAVMCLSLAAGCGSGGSKSSGPSSSLPPLSSASSSSASSSASVSSLSSAVQSSSAPAMVPFVLPFDDASEGVTDVAPLNHKPAGQWGPLGVSDAGHFVLNEQRIRFLGVNITAGSAFPSRENAEKVARRLAKFGVNLVRFHHLDNNYGAPSLIDYSAGTSSTFNAENLDKLDYFVKQLKDQGIYINMNLLNSRQFRVGDGLPSEISALSWKESHVLGFVNDTFRNLEKGYAQALLSHVNRYTAMTYAEDPAVAFVEINNENGIFQQYFDGALDSWPGVFRAQLDEHWNQWLQDRYESTAEAESAWGAIAEPLGEERLANGNFSQGTLSWRLEQHGGAVANLQTGTYGERSGVQVQVTTAGGADWHVQLNQGGQGVTAGQIYTLSFWAKSPSPTTLTLSLQMDYDPWSTLESRQYTLTSEWQFFTTTFIAHSTDNNLRINFNGFGNKVTSVHLASVSFQSGGELGQLPDGETLEAGTVKGNFRSQGYTVKRQLDWAEFLRALETAYWADMNTFIKNTLEYSGLVTGTAVMNSPPSAQRQFDFADAHAYWQHPLFPGADWDAANWTVGNTSMVNSLNNTLSGLAKQRIHGIPFTVSEYQHASPNTYASEGPLLAAAYGALQDWDAIIFFAYDAAEDNWGAGYFSDFFSMNAHPTKMANLLVAANLFRRGDVARAQQARVMNFSPATELEILAQRGSAWNVANGAHLDLPNEQALISRLALDVSASPSGSDTPPNAVNGSVYTADTGQLQWDLTQATRGLVTVNTAKTKSVIGFIQNRTQQLGNVRIQVGATLQNWATVSLTMQEGEFTQPDAGGKLLIVTTGRTENSNMQWNSAGNSVGTAWGNAPTLVEVIPVVVDLPFAAERTRAWILNETGQRTASLAILNHEGKARLDISRGAATLWYEVEVEPAD